ncbi:hydroxysteroid dehydrogenase-like protein 2 [Neocloeon triangulifer]|uniref:hydroxysteroid dehydrogenase-like protein 2 n=1 Tax=Neocloeon triangulifer TaxID=2078957 RepID=UPI00286F6FA3|nr:hydroxysteroid dehydrogenase-like protein 2 [Neocloeon triangulifer]
MISNTGKLAGQTLFITGASRGIGKAIALKAAKDGANIVVAAKTADPHPKLPGTIYSAAKEIEAAGGKALPCVVDVRDEKSVASAVEDAVKAFGGIDILINNASAISLTPTLHTDMKRYDLMHSVNTRGTFLVSKLCLPHLLKSKNAHILNLSPPLNMAPHWFKDHVAYTMAKYGMSMCVLGMAEEFRDKKVAVNALWPRTAILTAAMEMLAGGQSEAAAMSRKPDIMADAAYLILTKDSGSFTGNFTIDDEVLAAAGIKDFDSYAVDPSQKDNLMPDFFLDVAPEKIIKEHIKKEKSDGGATGGVAKVFKSIEANLSEELVGKIQAIYQFNVSGSEEGKWFLDLKTGKGSTGKGDAPSAADATLSMDSRHFADMFAGKLKPASAFMTGKLKISGNLQKAMKLEKLMGHLKAKM